MHDLIIIGAGPTGLMAAYEATRAGRKVLILEARERTGGRAYTKDGIEMGAEFIHGDLPILLSLVKAAGLSYEASAGEWIQLRAGETGEALTDTEWPALLKMLGTLTEDMSLQDFLSKYFKDNKYAALKDRAISFAEGFDTADASRASAKALFEEWGGIEEEEQYRIKGGYCALWEYLLNEISAKGGELLLSHAVGEISVAEDAVSVIANGQSFKARQCIVAVPLGILQGTGLLRINARDADTYLEAIKALGFGDVIKFIFRFREPFWEAEYPDMGFLLSAAAIPTWWTQLPERSNVLTGWLGGRPATTHAAMPNEQLIDIALDTLAQIFSRERAAIDEMLVEGIVVNWSADPYARGSYAYATVGYEQALELLQQPLGGRLYFAGEYMYKGAAMGTVEAALWSGQEVAKHL
jgi:monoamine oxidase